MRNGLSFWVWLRGLIYFWVRSQAIPKDPIVELGIDLKKPICFVLKTNSLADLLVLDHHCRTLGLPLPYLRPGSLRTAGKWASYIYLLGLELLTIDRTAHKRPPSPILELLKQTRSRPDFDVQLIPASVFWGRKAESEQKSFWDLLFSDDDRASIFRKIFIVIFQGRNVFINFSKPILLREQIDINADIDQVARKITRVLRVHFTTKRAMVLGPAMPSRTRVMESIIRTRTMRAAIEEESKKKNISIDRAEQIARRYVLEIAADIFPSFISATEIILRWLWNRIYEGVEIRNGQKLRAIPSQNTIIYMPCHRSHMDYLLITYTLFFEGVSTCYIAAGINLNFWPVGPFIRRCGAFFIRRSFKNNRLYSITFNEYVHFLLSRGAPVKFFPEGGRSRTGKLLPPKTGMLSMVVHSFLRLRDKPVTIVPIYVGYDKVAEVSTYRKELTGEAKTKESIWVMLKGTRKAIRSSHGKAYVSFGEPIHLNEFLNNRKPGWDEPANQSDSKPPWMADVVSDIADLVMRRINETSALTPIGLVSLILIASRQKALSEEDLTYYIQTFRDIVLKSPFSSDMQTTEMIPEEMIQYAERLVGIKRFKHASGDVLFAQEPEASNIIYYRNMVSHIFVMPSLVAAFLMHNDVFKRSVLLDALKIIYPILQREFTLPWDEEGAARHINISLQALVQNQLIYVKEDSLQRAEMTSKEFGALRILGWVIGPSIERYAIAMCLLWQYRSQSQFDLSSFENECVLLAQRISLLTGAVDAELPTSQLVKYIMEHLRSTGHLQKLDDTHYRVEEKFKEIYAISSALLSSDIRQSIHRMEKSPHG